MRLTFDKRFAQTKLDQARKSDTTIWPEVAYVSDIHPIVEWLVDKVLVRLGRQEAPVLVTNVDGPTYLAQGVLSNVHGQPIVMQWLGICGLPDNATVRPMAEVLEAAQVRPSMPNPGFTPPLADLQRLLPDALDAARKWLETERAGRDDTTGEPLLRVLAVLAKLVAESRQKAVGVSGELREGLRRSVELIANEVLDRIREQGVRPDPAHGAPRVGSVAGPRIAALPAPDPVPALRRGPPRTWRAAFRRPRARSQIDASRWRRADAAAANRRSAASAQGRSART